MPEQSLRFCIADTEKNIRAATWKIWSPNQKNDVYLACRELNGAVKVSLHQSNQWHIAYDQEFFNSKVPKSDNSEAKRFIHTWDCPSSIGPGITLALRVVTPWTAVGSALQFEPKVKYINKPEPEKAIEIGIFISGANSSISNWPAKNTLKSQLVGSYDLPNQSSVWVTYWECECPDFSGLPTAFNFFKGVRKSDIAETVRAMIFGDHSDGSKVLYDLLGKKA